MGEKERVYKLEVKIRNEKVEHGWKWVEIFKGSWDEAWEMRLNLLDECIVREVKGDEKESL